jgi:hypothetical protein
VRREWATVKLAAAFVLITDLLGLAVGFLISLGLIGVMVMLVFGPTGEGGKPSEIVMWALIVSAMVCPFVVLLLFKRVMLPLLGIRSGRPAWEYSFAASLLASIFITVLPGLAAYLLTYPPWK